MDAPQGRYRIVEKEGRLVVIDNRTGSPIPSSVAPPSPSRPGRGADAPAGPVAPAGPGPVDRAADLLLALVANRWDEQGRAVIAWEWRESSKVRRWDAALDSRQQRRLGRALLALAAGPLLLVLAVFADVGLFGLAILLALPPLAWAAFAIRRLQRETDDPGLRG
ncbi:MAG TPA: hypothetical protein VEA60_01980 [Allosphingosinicella sp.]|nr:hypothetical protein [Allosphingosinicella sp.]